MLVAGLVPLGVTHIGGVSGIPLCCINCLSVWHPKCLHMLLMGLVPIGLHMMAMGLVPLGVTYVGGGSCTPRDYYAGDGSDTHWGYIYWWWVWHP